MTFKHVAGNHNLQIEFVRRANMKMWRSCI